MIHRRAQLAEKIGNTRSSSKCCFNFNPLTVAGLSIKFSLIKKKKKSVRRRHLKNMTVRRIMITFKLHSNTRVPRTRANSEMSECVRLHGFCQLHARVGCNV